MATRRNEPQLRRVCACLTPFPPTHLSGNSGLSAISGLYRAAGITSRGPGWAGGSGGKAVGRSDGRAARRVVEKLLRELRFGATSTKLGRNLASLGQRWPALTNTWPNSGSVGRIWPNLDKTWPPNWTTLGQVWSDVGQSGPQLPDLCYIWQPWSKLGQFRPTLLDLGQILVNSARV